MLAKITDNIIKLYGIIWDGDGTYISNQIESVDGLYPKLQVHINTKGGDVFNGNDIYKALLRCKSEVDIYVDGIAASMGSILMLAGKRVYMTRSSFVMTHAPSGYVNGTAQEHLNAATLLGKLEKQFLDKYSAKTGKEPKELKSLLVGDNWMSAEDCLEMGLIDGIVDDVFKQEEITALKSMKVAAELKDNDPFEMSLNAVQTATNQSNKNRELKIKPNQMKKNLITAFAFLATANLTENSSDTAITNAIEDHINGLQKQIEDKDKKIKALKQSANDAAAKSISDEVEAAVKAGKIKAEQKEVFVGIGENSGLDALKAAFANMGGKPNIVATVNNGGSSSPTAKSWDEWQKEDPRGLEKLKAENPEAFNAVYKAKFGKDFE